jgi:hypothetical protein
MDPDLPEKRMGEGRRPEAYPFFRIFLPFLFREGEIKRGWVSLHELHSLPNMKIGYFQISNYV